jgi:hypothetical protein
MVAAQLPAGFATVAATVAGAVAAQLPLEPATANIIGGYETADRHAVGHCTATRRAV